MARSIFDQSMKISRFVMKRLSRMPNSVVRKENLRKVRIPSPGEVRRATTRKQAINHALM